MKRTLVILTLILAFGFFTTSYEGNKQVQLDSISNIISAESLKRSISSASLEFVNDSKEEAEENLRKLTELLNEYNGIAAYGVLENNDSLSETQYIYLFIPEGEQLTFTNQNGIPITYDMLLANEITSDPNQTNPSKRIDFTDPNFSDFSKLSYTIRPFTALTSEMLLNNSYFEVTSDRLSAFLEAVEDSSLNEAIRLVNTTDPKEVAEWLRIDLGMLKPSLLLVVIAFVILLFCYVFDSQKEILIRKMQGHTSLSILLQQFSPFFIKLLGLFAVVILGLYLLIVRNFRPAQMDFFQILLKGIGVFGFLILLSLLMGWIAVIDTKNTSMLKSSHVITNYSTAGLAALILSLVLCAVPLTQGIASLSQVVSDLVYLKKNEPLLKSSFVLGSFPMGSSEQENQDIEYLEAFFEKHSVIYQSLQIPDEELQEDLGISEDEQIPVMIVNRAYLERFMPVLPIISNEENVREGGDFLLVPSSKSGQSAFLETQYLAPSAIIQDQGTFAALSPSSTNRSIDNPPILVIDNVLPWQGSRGVSAGSTLFVFPNSESDKDALLKEIQELNKNLGVSIILDTADLYATDFQRVQSLFWSTASSVLVLLCYCAAIMYCFVRIYLNDIKIRLALEYFNGGSFIEKHGLFLLISAMSSFAVFLLIILLSDLAPGLAATYACAAFLCLMATGFLIFNRFKRKYALVTLKGDDV